jgi:hypothetical protein
MRPWVQTPVLQKKKKKKTWIYWCLQVMKSEFASEWNSQ